MRPLRLILLAASALVLAALVYHHGLAPIAAAALTRITWWQFALICLVHALNVAADSCGWRYAIVRDGAPLHRLMAARIAGDAVNLLTAVASVGGEATKAWLLRGEIPYQESVPSLIVSKTAELVAQVLLLALGLALALSTKAAAGALSTTLAYLLVVETIGVGGFLAVQIAGLVGAVGRVFSLAGGKRTNQLAHLDEALRGFYRHEWGRFLGSVALYFIGWLLGTMQALVILRSLGLPGSLVAATILEALWSAVRFATFLVPASLGTLEGATAAAFGAFGFGAGAGLAFALVRRASQAVWVGVGAGILVAMRPPRPVAPLASSAE